MEFVSAVAHLPLSTTNFTSESEMATLVSEADTDYYAGNGWSPKNEMHFPSFTYMCILMRIRVNLH